MRTISIDFIACVARRDEGGFIDDVRAPRGNIECNLRLPTFDPYGISALMTIYCYRNVSPTGSNAEIQVMH